MTGVQTCALPIFDEAWQSELWRRLLRQVPAAGRHLARLGREFEALIAGPRRQELVSTFPRRINVFGITSLAPATLGLLRRIAESVEVRIFVLNPARHPWGRSDVEPVEGPRLLSSFGKHVRALHDDLAAHSDGEGSVSPGYGSLLASLQSDVLDLFAPGVDIPSAWDTSSTATATLSGTCETRTTPRFGSSVVNG